MVFLSILLYVIEIIGDTLPEAFDICFVFLTLNQGSELIIIIIYKCNNYLKIKEKKLGEIKKIIIKFWIQKCLENPNNIPFFHILFELLKLIIYLWKTIYINSLGN